MSVLHLRMLPSFTDDLEQVRLNCHGGDLVLLLLRLLALLTDFSCCSLEEGWIKLVDDCEEPVSWDELLRLFIVWKILAHIWYLVDLVQYVLHREALQLVNVDIGHLGVEEVGFLSRENELEEDYRTRPLGWQEELTCMEYGGGQCR